MKIKFITNKGEFEAELVDNDTSKEVLEHLPIDSTINTWGKEVYFYVDVEAELEDDAKEVVEIGDVCYWCNGKAIAIFFGATPASRNGEPRAADLVNVFGKVDNVEILEGLEQGDKIRIEKVT